LAPIDSELIFGPVPLLFNGILLLGLISLRQNACLPQLFILQTIIQLKRLELQFPCKV